MSPGDAPLASGKEAVHFAADDQEPCAGEGWTGGWLVGCLVHLAAWHACGHDGAFARARPQGMPPFSCSCDFADPVHLPMYICIVNYPTCCRGGRLLWGATHACMLLIQHMLDVPLPTPCCRGWLGRLLWRPTHARPAVPGAAALLPRVSLVGGRYAVLCAAMLCWVLRVVQSWWASM